MSHCGRMLFGYPRLFVLVLVWICQPLTALSQAPTSTQSPEIGRLQGELASLRAAHAAWSQETDALRSEIEALRDAHGLTEKDLKDTKSKLEDTGWKALDFASQASGSQWAMFGSILAIAGLFLTIMQFGAYQLVLGNIKSAIRKEEVRLQREVNKSIKVMLEATRQSVQARTFSLIAFAFWEQHHEIAGASAAEVDEKHRNLVSALHLSKLSVDCALNSAGSPDSDTLLTTSQSNRAYYLAELANLARKEIRLAKQFSDEHREEALELASAVLPAAKKLMAADPKDLKWPEWMESWCWVTVNLDTARKAAALRQLRVIFEHATATDEMKNWIKKRYFENEEPTWA